VLTQATTSKVHHINYNTLFELYSAEVNKQKVRGYKPMNALFVNSEYSEGSTEQFNSEGELMLKTNQL
jgi:hypothetical protein